MNSKTVLLKCKSCGAPSESAVPVQEMHSLQTELHSAKQELEKLQIELGLLPAQERAPSGAFTSYVGSSPEQQQQSSSKWIDRVLIFIVFAVFLLLIASSVTL